MADPATIVTARLVLRPMTHDDVEAKEAPLSDPHIVIRVMCDSSSPEKRRAAAIKRIDWFNSYWDESGYGVRAVTIGDSDIGTPGRMIGWCGVAGYEGSRGEPEVLYALDRAYWGRGLVTEAARAAVSDFFARTDQPSPCAIIFEQLNWDSIRVAEKLGLTFRRRVDFVDFAPDRQNRQRALDYALWCAGSPAARQDAQLSADAAAKAGLIVGSGVGDEAEVRARLGAGIESPDLAAEVEAAFRITLEDPTCPYMSLSRDALE